MEIHGPGSVGGPGPVSRPHTTPAAGVDPPGQTRPARDEVEISEMAKLLNHLSRLEDVPPEHIEEVRRMIEAGTYETPEKIEMAVERLLDELRGEGA